MESLCAVSFPLLFIVGFVLLMWKLIQWGERQEQLRYQAWHAFATAHRLRFVPPVGPWYARQPAKIEGTASDVPITIDTYATGGKNSQTYTRLTARAIEPIAVNGRVYSEHIFGALGDALGFQDINVGDPVFDPKCVVKGDNEAAMRALLHKPLRDVLVQWLSLVNGGSLSYEQGLIRVIWLGAETDPNKLAGAVQIAVHAGAFRGVQPQVFR